MYSRLGSSSSDVEDSFADQRLRTMSRLMEYVDTGPKNTNADQARALRFMVAADVPDDDDESSRWDWLFPGTAQERWRYLVLEFLPGALLVLWLLMPLSASSCSLPEDAECFIWFLLGRLLLFLLPTAVAGWLSFELIVGPIPLYAMAIVSGASLVACLGGLYAGFWYLGELFTWPIVFGGCLVVMGAPLVIAFIVRAWQLQRQWSEVADALQSSESDDDSEHATLAEPPFLARAGWLIGALATVPIAAVVCELFEQW
eukprot:TRINITY_DN3171_c0_g1_i1.p1 TRINITY_DN3171_c0_g1~~TRINITY_DN3171_c0_g1_i1.p1  ORF type:complete len:258 (+),score=54.58 TRINITY_DN3171_c0_g1_i1:57-830(+)